MDTLGALALATEPPTDHLMDRAPVGRRYHFLSDLSMRVKSCSTIECSQFLFNLHNNWIYLLLSENLSSQISCGETCLYK